MEPPAFLSVKFGDGIQASVVGMGTVHLVSPHFPAGITLTNVLYAPRCKVNLISVYALTCDVDCKVQFTNTSCNVTRDNALLFKVPIHNTTYIIHAIACSQLRPPTATCQPAGALRTVATASDSPQLWHRRLGHPGQTQLKKLTGDKLLLGLPLTPDALHALDKPCHPCALGKARRTPFVAKPAPATRAPLQLVHSDLMGPFAPKGILGEKYLVSLVDDYSGLGEVFPIRKKSDTFTVLTTALKRWMTLKTGLPVKAMRSDGGGEYWSAEWDAWLREEGIQHQGSLPHSPQQNGKAERYNGVLTSIARTLMLDSGLTKGFWPYAFTTAAYLHAFHLHSAKHLTHFQLFYGYRPTVEHLRVFGALCYPTRVTKQPKLGQRADIGKLLGYCKDSVGYTVWLPETHEIIETCDVVFYESGSLTTPVISIEPFTVADEGGDSELEFETQPHHASFAFHQNQHIPSLPALPAASVDPGVPCRQDGGEIGTPPAAESDRGAGTPQQPVVMFRDTGTEEEPVPSVPPSPAASSSAIPPNAWIGVGTEPASSPVSVEQGAVQAVDSAPGGEAVECGAVIQRPGTASEIGAVRRSNRVRNIAPDSRGLVVQAVLQDDEFELGVDDLSCSVSLISEAVNISYQEAVAESNVDRACHQPGGTSSRPHILYSEYPSVGSTWSVGPG